MSPHQPEVTSACGHDRTGLLQLVKIGALDHWHGRNRPDRKHDQDRNGRLALLRADPIYRIMVIPLQWDDR